MSYNHGPIYMPGDKVAYTGEKFRGELTTKEGKPLPGWIHAPVKDSPGSFVVFFPDTKEQDSFVMSYQVLAKWRQPKGGEKHLGPEVTHMPTRRKKNEDE